MNELYNLEMSAGSLPNMVRLTYTEDGIKKIPEQQRERIWTDLLLHIHECKTKEESYAKAVIFMSERLKNDNLQL